VAVWLSFGPGETAGEDAAGELASAAPLVVVPVDDRRPPAARPADAAAPGTAPGASPGTSKAAPEPNPPDARVELVAAPAPGLTEPGPAGPLPKVAEDGRTPWQTYARPFVQGDPRPRIALVVAGMGASAAGATGAIRQLPGAVTLAFPAGAPQLARWVEEARADGHEVLLDLPMEPAGYPADDPGPNTLLASLRPEQNLDRLRRALSAATGYVGVTSLSGSGFTARPDVLRPVLQEVHRRGLLLLDGRAAPRGFASFQATEIGLPRAIGDAMVDAEPGAAAIDAELLALEEIARRGGTAVGVVSPYPVTLRRLASWLPTLRDKGLVLAPVSAVVNRQPDR
jgi:polysaccharide deacetylase 2 family uncharacterized protein YibQ